MSSKNSSNEKKIRQLRRAIKKGRLPVYLNLLEWLADHKYADTKGKAFKLIREQRVMRDSHVLGLSEIEENDGAKAIVVAPFVPARYRHSIHVVDATS